MALSISTRVNAISALLEFETCSLIPIPPQHNALVTHHIADMCFRYGASDHELPGDGASGREWRASPRKPEAR